MRQQCCEVTADRRYVVGADLLAGDVGWEADAFAQLRMLMTRSGEIVECSEPTRAIAIPFPTHPIFVGETWKKETKIPFENPFTHILDIFPLEYTYELADVIGERHATARIYASCPQFEFGLGHGASLSISARAVTHFDIHRGLLLRSNVESISVIRIGREKTETLMKIAIVLEPE
jgi:hypothetical protein